MPRRISAHTPHNAVRTARIPRRLLWTVCILSAALCVWQLAVYKGACMNMGDAYSYGPQNEACKVEWVGLW